MNIREQIYSALFALGQTITWTDPTSGQPVTLQYSSRRVKSFADIPQQPALLQAEGDELFSQTTGLPYQQTITAHWVFLHQAGANASATPASTNNEIVDNAIALLTSPVSPKFTLGGLADHVWINGKVYKDGGDLDSQGLVVIPISIKIPT